MTTSSPLRVAYRWLTAARPIPLDKRAINEATSEVTRRIMLAINSRSGDPDEPLSSQRIPRQIDGGSFPLSQVIRDGEGLVPSDLHVPIQVRFLNRPPRNMTLLLGGSLVSQSDLFSGFQHSLEIRASSALSASEYRDQNGLLQREIYSVLLHEVTHAVDLVGRMRDDYSPADARDGAAAYINQPHEIRAFMRQVVEEVIPSVRVQRFRDRSNMEEGIRVGLRKSPTWKKIQRHLTRENRNRILKAVYTATQDAGLVG